eukprot:4788820-Lingulodinium_polyedra.AAC.1
MQVCGHFHEDRAQRPFGADELLQERLVPLVVRACSDDHVARRVAVQVTTRNGAPRSKAQAAFP